METEVNNLLLIVKYELRILLGLPIFFATIFTLNELYEQDLKFTNSYEEAIVIYLLSPYIFSVVTLILSASVIAGVHRYNQLKNLEKAGALLEVKAIKMSIRRFLIGDYLTLKYKNFRKK